MEAASLNIGNICNGAVLEVFQRAVEEVAKNIKDLNTGENTKRKVTLEFTFAPFPDRTGANVSFNCSTKLSSVKAVPGIIFVTEIQGKATAFAHDPRQEALFHEPVAAPQQ